MTKPFPLSLSLAQMRVWVGFVEEAARLSDEELKPLLEAMDAEALAALQLMDPERVRRLGYEVHQDELVRLPPQGTSKSSVEFPAPPQNLPKDGQQPEPLPAQRYRKDTTE